MLWKRNSLNVINFLSQESIQPELRGDEEPTYGHVIPRADRTHYRTTSDGFVINQDTELQVTPSYNLEEEAVTYDEEGSEYVFDETTGQAVRRVKKVSFAAEDERFVIERPGEVKGLGLSRLFSFGPPKPMKSLPGKEKKADGGELMGPHPMGLDQLEVPPVVPARSSSRRSTSKEASPAAGFISPEATSPKAFIAAMTGGLLGVSRSPDPSGRRETASTSPNTMVGSVFGTLLKRGHKTSRPGSKTGSRTSSADRSSHSQDLGSEDNVMMTEGLGGEGGRTSSRGSNFDENEDARSESSLVQRLGLKKKKKPAKVQMADFDELFARGMARSAQIESENNMNPFQSTSGSAQAAVTMAAMGSGGAAGNERYDEYGTRFTPFEVYSHDEAFRRTQQEEGIGYAEKVLSYLDDQAHAPAHAAAATASIEMPEGRERGRERHRPKHSRDSSGGGRHSGALEQHGVKVSSSRYGFEQNFVKKCHSS